MTLRKENFIPEFGFINVYKRKGMTSHDVVWKIRKLLGIKKVGHAGTLDPNAEGVLLVAFGRATKFIQYLELLDKVYEAEIIFGKTTDTYDITGIPTKTSRLPENIDDIEEIFQKWIGKRMQKPPMYSAIKKNGKHLYDYARAGEIIEVDSRLIELKELSLIELSNFPNGLKFRVRCSKGTYIRSLCYDIGQALKVEACMGELLRTQIGDFNLKEAWELDELKELSLNNELERAILLPDTVLVQYNIVHSTERGLKFVRNGNALFPWNSNDDFSQYKSMQILRIHDEEANFLGLGQFITTDEECENSVYVKPIKLI